MRQTQAIIAGHSHTICLGVPGTSESPKLVDLVNGDARFLGLIGPWPRDQAYWDLLVQATAGRKVAIFWDGNQHLGYYLFASPPPFDFFLSHRPDLPGEGGVHLVPETAIRARFAPTFELLHHVIMQLKASTPDCQPIICGTPPPKGDDARLRQLMANELLFVCHAEYLKVSLQDVELTPPRLRFKLWAVLQMMLQDVAFAHAVPFVPIPASVQTADGFLDEQYWWEDATHANFAYGKVMLDHLGEKLNLTSNGAGHG